MAVAAVSASRTRLMFTAPEVLGRAEKGTAFVNFGATRPGPGAGERFMRLVDACEAFAAERGLTRLDVGMNLAREDAYRSLTGRGYRTWLQGVAMRRPNEPGYHRPDIFVIDDWR